jgi:hypothetical protein
VNIVSGRWYRELDKPVQLTRTGIEAIELMIASEKYTDIRLLEDHNEDGTALIEWRSGVGKEIAVFEWEASQCNR